MKEEQLTNDEFLKYKTLIYLGNIDFVLRIIALGIVGFSGFIFKEQSWIYISLISIIILSILNTIKSNKIRKRFDLKKEWF